MKPALSGKLLRDITAAEIAQYKDNGVVKLIFML